MKPLTIITCTAATIAALAGTAVGDLQARHAQRSTPATDAQLQKIEVARPRAIQDRIPWEADVRARGLLIAPGGRRP